MQNIVAPEYLAKTDVRARDGSYLHQYKCYCGQLFLALPRYINTKKTVSCGCYRRSGGAKCRLGKSPGNSLADPAKSSFNGMFLGYKNSAKRKSLPFVFSKDEFRNVTQSNCYYCGTSPLMEHWHTKWARAPYISNGIDRYDNNLGYTHENSVPCCSECNYLKRDIHGDAFIAHIEQINNNIRKVSK